MGFSIHKFADKRILSALFVGGGVFVCSFVLLGNGTLRAQTLEAELGRAAADAPEVISAIQQSEAAWSRARQAFGGHLPSVDITADGGKEKIGTKNQDEAEFSSTPTSNRAKATGTVTVNLVSGGRIHGSYKQSLAAYRESQYRVDDAVATYLQDGGNAYAELWGARQLIQNSQQVEAMTSRLLELQRRSSESGSGVAVDDLQIQLRLLQTQEQRVDAETRLKAAIEGYRRQFRVEPPTQLVQPTIPVPFLPATRSDAVELALSGSPTLLARQQRVAGSDAARTVARAGYFPSIDLVASYDHEDKVGGATGVKRTTSVLGRATWNVFNGVQSTNGVRAAGADFMAADAEARRARIVAEERALVSFDAYLGRAERARILKRSYDIAIEIKEARESARRSGNATEPEVIEGEISAMRGNDLLISATVSELTAAYELLANVGQLTPAVFGIEESFPVRRDPDAEVGLINVFWDR